MPSTGSRTFVSHEASARLDVSTALPRAALWALVAAKLVAGWGVQWDIAWHIRIGRDTFWIAPHVMTYAGVSASVLLTWGVLAWYTARGGRGDRMIRVLGIWGTRGFHLAAWGNALTVLAAPVDDLWHRLFGLDVTLWSPPHLLGIFGGLVSSAACLAIAGEVYAPRPTLRVVAQIVAGATFFRGLALVVQPAFLLAFAHGGVLFHSPAILSALFLPLALVAAAIVSGRRWSPALVLAVVIALAVIGEGISNTGFAWLRPVSVIDQEIVKEPNSPIALATRIARMNGEEPGQSGIALLVALLVAAVAMGVTDARRRPALAAVVYGAVMFASWAWLLANNPAFKAMVPSAGATLAGLAITLASAAVAGCAGRALANRLRDDS
jgi:hypothetical protein